MMYGATLVSLNFKGTSNSYKELTLNSKNYDDLFEKEKNFNYGATIGRVSGKIANASYNLGEEVKLKRPPFHENGGTYGFGRHLWHKAEIIKDFPLDGNKTGTGVMFSRTSEDKEEGFQGRIEI